MKTLDGVFPSLSDSLQSAGSPGQLTADSFNGDLSTLATVNITTVTESGSRTFIGQFALLNLCHF